MALRTRIAVTFALLLAAVLAAALGAVSVVNHGNAAREAERQLDLGTMVFKRLEDSNRRVLTQAAQAVAADYGFREAMAARDTATLSSALENGGARIGAGMVVLTSLDGRVMAASASQRQPGAPFPNAALEEAKNPADGGTHVLYENGRIYELVTVAVKSPLPVAWISMGFELDDRAARELADITGLGVTLSVRQGAVASDVATAVPGGTADGARARDVAVRRIPLASLDRTEVYAVLSRSLAEARAPFERLTHTLFWIGGVSLLAFAWAAFWIARNITRPLSALTRSVARIRDGSYDGALPLPRVDELGVLAEGLELMQRDVRSRDQFIRRLAYEDALTGLMNRAAFSAALNQTLAEAGDAPVGVVSINLDRFRRINEHLGYSVGDAVLTQIAKRLAGVPSIGGRVARVAADQFAAFTRLADAGDLSGWGTSLLVALAEPVVVEAQPIDVNATIGLALRSGGAVSADDLSRCAELALEDARRHKRPLAVYDDALQPETRDQLSLLGELRRAIEHDEIRLFFQPKIDFATDRIAGAEVLLRWQHPTRGLIGPASFVPFAEKTGFIRRLTRWLLDRAIAQAAQWHREGNSIALAVNVSAEDIADPRLHLRVAGLLSRHRLPPPLLTLELTESSFIEDPQHALRALDALAALGVNLSIDDFGTGYSSLSHLARMPVHEVKIDRSFVQAVETNTEFATVVRSAIDMGHRLGLRVVAEGIETAASARQLKDFGCDVAQGFFYAKPMPVADLLHWLDGKPRLPVVAVPVDFDVEDVTDTVSLATY